MTMKQGSKNGYYLLYLFIMGLFLGILLVNIRHDFWIKDDGLLNTAMLEQLEGCEFNGNFLLGYILKHRISAILIIGILASTMIGLPIVCGYVCYLGLSAGCVLSVAVIRYGIRGLFFAAASIFPQILFFIPGYLLLFSLGLECNRNLYGKNGGIESYPVSGKQLFLKCAGRFLGILLFVIIGCILECYVNPQIVHFILKIF